MVFYDVINRKEVDLMSLEAAAQRQEKLRRTQICLSQKEHALVREIARSKGISMSQVIREAVHQYADKEKVGLSPERMLAIVGVGRSPNRRASIEHDKTIYG
jgi:hypothetical protein